MVPGGPGEPDCAVAIVTKENPVVPGGAPNQSSSKHEPEAIARSEYTSCSAGPPRSDVTADQSERPRKKRILIIDDNKDLATSQARLFRLLGYEVEAVFDGRQGIDVALEYCPEVVLLDIGLPNFDGYQVARGLRQAGLLDAVIIAVSGYGLDEDQRRAREAGMNFHVTKPVDVKTIAALIGDAV